MTSKYVNVCGRRIKYDSRFDFSPYYLFYLMEDEYGMVLQVVDSLLCQCHKKFKSADVSSINILRMLDCYECKVTFSISDDDRLAYEREVKRCKVRTSRLYRS